MKINFRLPNISFHDAYLENIQVLEKDLVLDFNYGYLFEEGRVFHLDRARLCLLGSIEENSNEILLYRQGLSKEITLEDFNRAYNFTCMDILFGEDKACLQGYVTARGEEDFLKDLPSPWASCTLDLYYRGGVEIFWEEKFSLEG